MGSSITQPLKTFFSKDKVEQNPSMNNGNLSENLTNGRESSDDASAPAQSQDSEMSSDESTCTILSSEDEEPPTLANMCDDHDELKENITSEKDELWSKLEKYDDKVLDKEMGVTIDDPTTQNEDSRPNIFELRYKSSNSEEFDKLTNELNVNLGQPDMNGTSPSEQDVVESELVVSTSQTPESSKDLMSDSIQSKIPDKNFLPSNSVLSDEVGKSPVNNNRPNSLRNYNNYSYRHHISYKSPVEVKGAIWMRNQIKKLYTPHTNNNTLSKINYINRNEGPPLGLSVFTQLNAKRQLSSYSDSNNKPTIATDIPRGVKGKDFLNQHKSQLYNNPSTSSMEKHKPSFEDWYPLPGGGYRLYKKNTDPNTGSEINQLNRGTSDQYGNERHATVIRRSSKSNDFDIYRFRRQIRAVNDRRNALNYRSKSLYSTSEVSSENPVPEFGVTDQYPVT